MITTSVLFSPPLKLVQKAGRFGKGGQGGTGNSVSVSKHFGAILMPCLCLTEYFGTFASFKQPSALRHSGHGENMLWVEIWQSNYNNISHCCSFDTIWWQQKKTRSPYANCGHMRGFFNDKYSNSWLQDNNDDDSSDDDLGVIYSNHNLNNKMTMIELKNFI